MAMTHDLMPSLADRVTVRHPCPNCGRPMHLTRITPRTEGLSDLHTYRCGECGVWATEAAEGADDKS